MKKKENFGKNLKILRKEKGIALKGLSKEIGITKSVLSAYETQTRYPNLEKLIIIADYFETSIDSLLEL